MDHPIASRAEWLSARKTLLEREKALTRERDALCRQRRALPWVRIDKEYRFETEDGARTLVELFDGCAQLLVYHFMFAPDWEVGCKSCSFWADSFHGSAAHLRQRDTRFTAVSRAPLATLLGFRRRMGWSFPWASSQGSDFNFDFGVSFRPDDAGGTYNYAPKRFAAPELPGLSAFIRDGETVYHTYSTYGRGIEPFNATYALLDLTPLGRQEDGAGDTMAWVKLHDLYATG
ncbi:DUF899 domain-containing protein [Nitratireductor alexandrii]|uniref:DUF899 domain-containing protein n=1 Tax=Nitratireductor alexandrii TaxID=2448161 RepID=UPI000FD70A61|nr:DUF899 domain-containing protein [Nitratireductor alexandrii]